MYVCACVRACVCGVFICMCVSVCGVFACVCACGVHMFSTFDLFLHCLQRIQPSLKTQKNNFKVIEHNHIRKYLFIKH